MTAYLVTIQDKMLAGEPDVALAVVEAGSLEEAARAADGAIDELAAVGRCRCVAHARELELGRVYRLGALVRIPRQSVDP